jgi:HemK-related putative methylase
VEIDRPKELYFELPGMGRAQVAGRFRDLFTEPVAVRASRRAGDVLELLDVGRTVVVTGGEFTDLRILVWYVMRYRETLEPGPGRHRGPAERRERQDRIRDKVHRLMVPVRGEEMVGIEGAPSLEGLSEWANWDPREDTTYLVPARRIMRILTDMKRRSEGIHIRALGGSIVILPHVYVPFDQSIIDLLDANLEVGPSDEVLDVGTGTGVLALLAARKGAGRVVATDILDQAVLNARENVKRLGLDERVEVRDPCDLFDCVQGKFDAILFNPPWIRGGPRSEYEESLYDDGGMIISRFMAGVAEHLKDGGRIYLIYSDISESTGEGSITGLMDLIDSNGLRVIGDTWRGRRSRVTGARERVHLFEIARVGTSG